MTLTKADALAMLEADDFNRYRWGYKDKDGKIHR
jgi:hypothetical protein